MDTAACTDAGTRTDPDSPPLVSVVVPIYDGADFVDACCGQLAYQTLSPIEVILVDDGSNDGSATICDRMQERYPNVRVLHQENLGVSTARNAGTALARGAYVAYVDVDDEFDKDMLEFACRIARSTDADVVCLDPACPDSDGMPTVLDGRRAVELLLGAPPEHRARMECIKDDLRRTPRELVSRYFIRNDRIRLRLYLHCLPAFLLLLRTIDGN